MCVEAPVMPDPTEHGAVYPTHEYSYSMPPPDGKSLQPHEHRDLTAS